jgi:hypothetical protein
LKSLELDSKLNSVRKSEIVRVILTIVGLGANRLRITSVALRRMYHTETAGANPVLVDELAEGWFRISVRGSHMTIVKFACRREIGLHALRL